MSRRDRRELESRLALLACHLLKWQRQPEGRTASWSATIREQRRQIARNLAQAPSLRPLVDDFLAKIYAAARQRASAETGIPEENFPAECPFAVADLLSGSFLPI
jgi:hypothetical protein